jgi:hypothetical protein
MFSKCCSSYPHERQDIYNGEHELNLQKEASGVENGQMQGASTATAEIMVFRFVAEITILMRDPN